jgi:hypothetical protein
MGLMDVFGLVLAPRLPEGKRPEEMGFGVISVDPVTDDQRIDSYLRNRERTGYVVPYFEELIEERERFKEAEPKPSLTAVEMSDVPKWGSESFGPLLGRLATGRLTSEDLASPYVTRAADGVARLAIDPATYRAMAGDL